MAAIHAGQNVWQSMGGMEVGSVWGHGSYVAPDWTADWLHREATFILDEWGRGEFGADYAGLSPEQQGQLQRRLQEVMRRNTYDPATGVLDGRPGSGPGVRGERRALRRGLSDGRDAYAIPAGALSDPDKLRQLASFFFWTSWAASTNRPGETITYTSNWPHEPLVGNVPTGEAVVWTGVSIILLLAGIAAMVWYYAARREEEARWQHSRRAIRCSASKATPSQRATVKYFWTVAALFLVQILLGRRHGALRRRGRRASTASRHRVVPAVHRRPDVAPAARDLLDRDRLAGGRALHRPGGRRRSSRRGSGSA